MPRSGHVTCARCKITSWTRKATRTQFMKCRFFTTLFSKCLAINGPRFALLAACPPHKPRAELIVFVLFCCVALCCAADLDSRACSSPDQGSAGSIGAHARQSGKRSARVLQCWHAKCCLSACDCRLISKATTRRTGLLTNGWASRQSRTLVS